MEKKASKYQILSVGLCREHYKGGKFPPYTTGTGDYIQGAFGIKCQVTGCKNLAWFETNIAVELLSEARILEDRYALSSRHIGYARIEDVKIKGGMHPCLKTGKKVLFKDR
jgi:hypothetical protein